MILRSLTKHVKDQNWFAVGLDFVIVVIGVGVAMMGQQWLSDRQQRQNMSLAETALRSDLLLNYMFARERMAVSACRLQAYGAIAEKLLEPGESWTGLPRTQTESFFDRAIPALLRSPSRNWGSRIWEAELARGTFNQMDDDRRSVIDGIFSQTQSAESLQDDIFTLQGRMKALAVSTNINQSDRLRYYDMLGEIDEKSAGLEIVSGQIASSIEEVGVEFSDVERKEIFNGLAATNERSQTIYGDCYEPVTFPIFDAPNGKAELQ